MNWILESEAKKDAFLDKLIEFLKIPSVLDESTATKGAPFGKSINDALQYMLELGEADGFTVKNLEGYAGHIEYGNGEEIVGILQKAGPLHLFHLRFELESFMQEEQQTIKDQQWHLILRLRSSKN
jgi:acetylornithine deacetylase/succinyl-diaminopimelate desuccinylase-like protein